MPVPLLPIDPSAEDVRAYLVWLAASPYIYHIDDNPEDLLPALPLPVVVALRWNSDRMWGNFDGWELWDWYPSETNA